MCDIRAYYLQGALQNLACFVHMYTLIIGSFGYASFDIIIAIFGDICLVSHKQIHNVCNVNGTEFVQINKKTKFCFSKLLFCELFETYLQLSTKIGHTI